MSNAKQILTTLLSNITAAFEAYPDEDKDLFRSNFNGALDLSTTILTQINGHTHTTIINSLRSTLQAVSERTSSSETAISAWNPIIAAVFTTLEGVILEQGIDDISSRVRNISVSNTQSSGQVKKIATTGGLPQRPSQIKLPVVKSQPAKTVPSKPTVSTVKLSTCPIDVTSRVRVNAMKEFKNSTVFKNLPHLKCSTVNCAFCVKLWSALELTKCSEIKCHRKGTVCNRDGWFAHVFPTMWLAAKIDHDAGLPFPGLSKYAPKFESSKEKLSLKRPVTYADVTAENSVPMEFSPASPQKRFAFSVEDDLPAEEAWTAYPKQDDSNEDVLHLNDDSFEEGEILA